MAVGLEASLSRFPKAVVIRALTFFRSFRVAVAGAPVAAAAAAAGAPVAAAAAADVAAASPTANPSIRSNKPTDSTIRSNNRHPTA